MPPESQLTSAPPERAAQSGDAEETAREIVATGGQAIAVQADVACDDQVQTMVGQVVERLGGIGGVMFTCKRSIQQLLEYLDAHVGRGRYVLALTADHGVCPLPEVSRSQGKNALRVDPKQRWHPVYLLQPFYNLLLMLFFEWGVAMHDLDFSLA